MDLDSQLPEQDFDYSDDDDEDSNIEDEVDEDFLLQDHEEIEMRNDSESTRSHNGQDSNVLSVNDDGLSGYTDNSFSDEPEDDEISLHPDDSLFDEEDEPAGNTDRLRPRLVQLLNYERHLSIMGCPHRQQPVVCYGQASRLCWTTKAFHKSIFSFEFLSLVPLLATNTCHLRLYQYLYIYGLLHKGTVLSL